MSFLDFFFASGMLILDPRAPNILLIIGFLFYFSAKFYFRALAYIRVAFIALDIVIGAGLGLLLSVKTRVFS
jgi:hypothetical protein